MKNILLLFSAVLLSIVSLQNVISAQSVPVTEIFDGTKAEGNQHFFFLQPLVADPSFSGIFDNSLEPVVEICEVDNGLCQFPPIAQFPFGGKNGVRLTDDIDEVHYKLNFTPSDYNLDPYSQYQIRVLVDGLLMGFVTVSGDLGYLTIPVQFRLEEGCTDWGAVGPEGGIIEFTNGVVFDVPANAVNSYVAIGIFPLPTEQAQALLDERPYRSSDKTVLGGFLAEPDGFSFNVPITVRLQILPTDKLLLQAKLSLDPPEYWIVPTELIYDPSTNIAEFPLNHFSGTMLVKVEGSDLGEREDCKESIIQVKVESNDFARGNGCQIISEKVEVKFLECPGQPKESVLIAEITPECGKYFSLILEILPATVKECQSTMLQTEMKDQTGKIWTDIPIVWRSNSKHTARIHPDYGEITGIEGGENAYIDAWVEFFPQCYDGIQLYVEQAQIPVQSPSSTVKVGETITLSAIDEGVPFHCETRTEDGLTTELIPVTWVSMDPTKASVVDEIGTIKGENPDFVEIKAISCNAEGSIIIEVIEEETCDDFTNAYIELGPDWFLALDPGETDVFTAKVMVYDQETQTYIHCPNAPLKFTPLDPSIATVTQTGIVTAGDYGGETYIEVELVGYPNVDKKYMTIYVLECGGIHPLLLIEPAPYAGGLPGTTVQLTAVVYVTNPHGWERIATDCYGDNFLWWSNDESVVTVSQSGLATARNVGKSSIEVKLIDHPEIDYGYKPFWTWKSVCDKDGDGKLDGRIGSPWGTTVVWGGSCYCSYNPKWSENCDCEGTNMAWGLQTDCGFDPVHNFHCPVPFNCIPGCRSNVQAAKCITGEIRHCILPCGGDDCGNWTLGYWEYWDEGCPEPVEAHHLIFQADREKNIPQIHSEERTLPLTEVRDLDSLMQDLDMNNGCWSISVIDDSVVIHTSKKRLDEKGIAEFETVVPTQFTLDQNYPNPFNPITKISYQLPKELNITLKVYNVLGKEVATLVNEKKLAGSYDVEFDASRLPSGIYFYILQAGDYIETKKMVLLR